MTTITYINGGDYQYTRTDQKLKEWRGYGKAHNQKWLYKGYRYYDGKKDAVVVFTTERWDGQEIARRRNNGFLGIKEYSL